ncbi:hypothetical protein UY3_00280 [Chelonia mydas]|uniref:Uncharacterized protein n=1 Tax=Chelonia mydas TaxID=8469 RepID=M7BX71_CHEMY|nr:hypothetical protein UY3_00280 [Chelonia mydas]
MHQCHAKIKELRQAYQKEREANCRSGAVPKTCCFYKELDIILGGDPTSTAKSPVDALGDTSTGGGGQWTRSLGRDSGHRGEVGR